MAELPHRSYEASPLELRALRALEEGGRLALSEVNHVVRLSGDAFIALVRDLLRAGLAIENPPGYLTLSEAGEAVLHG